MLFKALILLVSIGHIMAQICGPHGNSIIVSIRCPPTECFPTCGKVVNKTACYSPRIGEITATVCVCNGRYIQFSATNHTCVDANSQLCRAQRDGTYVTFPSIPCGFHSYYFQCGLCEARTCANPSSNGCGFCRCGHGYALYPKTGTCVRTNLSYCKHYNETSK